MNSRRSFLYGFSLGIMLATVSSYYHFCRPNQPQSVTDLMIHSELAKPVSLIVQQ